MRLILLAICAGVGAGVFVTMLVATARHRSRGRCEAAYRSAAPAEYVWMALPWLMMIGCALPAVRQILAAH